MKGSEFLKRVKKYAKAHDLEMEFTKAHGKGSHGTLYLGQTGKTTVKDRKKEIGPGLLTQMLEDLGIPPSDF